MTDPPLRLVGRDVLFVHWPAPVDAVREVVQEPLTVDVVDGSAWLSVLAHEVSETTFASLPVSRSFSQVNFRTYVRFDGDPGVYFFSLDSGNRSAALAARRLFGLPFRPARGSVRRRDGWVVLRSRRAARGEPQARFDARYRPLGEPRRVDPDSVTGRLVERHRYFVPGEGTSRVLRAVAGRSTDDPGVYVGEATRDPWRLVPARVDIRANTLFAAIGLDPPETEPIAEYSPVYESRVRGTEFAPTVGRSSR